MSPITTAFRLALTAATLVAASAATADAKPRRVVVLEFDGPKPFVESGRTAVVNLVGQQYDVVATKRWKTAQADAAQHAHGPATWNEASRKAGVDAVIEGWVQSEGRGHTLNLTVKDATTGNEIDTVVVKLGDKGLSSASEKQLGTDLENVLDWADSAAGTANDTAIPVVKIDRVMVGAKPDAAAASTDDAAPAEHEPKAKTTAADEEPGKPHNELLEIFGPDSKEIAIADKAVLHVPQPTPRFEISAGGYYGSRSLEFVAETPPTEYPGTSSKGISLHAAFYPFPTKKIDGRLSGLGATFSLYHAVGSTVTSDEGDQVVDYSIDQNGWDLGLHYRLPLDMVNLDFQAFYGQDDYIISGASAEFDVPDTGYRYIGVGAAVELQVTDHATIGFGAKYFDVLDTGDLSQQMWYGPGASSGLALNASFTVPLPSKMFVRGDLSYKRFTLEPTGGGDITDMNGVDSATDTTVQASVELGIAF